ncbi:hypothetical protein AB0P21_41095 [Kribbella sp. NPDC056861]|uniref:hypothetical protein n=1 Tax=Kribbella sp. NPDC056861 TaxID=3154857 RepID=UPI003430E967
MAGYRGFSTRSVLIQPKESATGNTTESVDVDVDVSTAYNQRTQFESFPQFMDGVDEITQLDDTHLPWKTCVSRVRRHRDPSTPTSGSHGSPTTAPVMPASSPSTAWATSRPG